MAEVILAVLGRRHTVHAVLDAAHRLAALVGRASIVVLAVDAPPPAFPLAAEALMAELGDVSASRRRDRMRIASLRSSFDAWASDVRQAGIVVQWNEVEGAEMEVVEAHGRRADFVVIARPTQDDDAPTRHGFQAALLHTERPVLVVPQARVTQTVPQARVAQTVPEVRTAQTVPQARAAETVPDGKPARLGRCVAIAWRDDSRTAKAVIPALRLLGSARQVHLLAGVREKAATPVIPAVLLDHGISASLHVLPIGQEAFGKALLEKAHELGADMLVMGAYAHRPLHEAIFGGVTRYVLDHADVPVLMQH
jgi:nucleotide-binding universal stress UspA family protein